MDNPNDVVTHSITIELGLDGKKNVPFWVAKFKDLVGDKEPMDLITGFGMLACAAFDLAQQAGMIPMPEEEENDGEECT